jgi:hypothetical protein
MRRIHDCNALQIEGANRDPQVNPCMVVAAFIYCALVDHLSGKAVLA